jgi:hypothetical protein
MFLIISVISGLSLGSRLVRSALDEQPGTAAQPAEAPKPDAPPDAQPEPITAPEQSPAPLTEQSYTGTNQCFICHRPQTDSWSESKHAQAFTSVPEAYRRDASCLKCHVTAFGELAGFVAGADKDLLMVGCESCHGPGALHIDAAKRFVLATPEEEAKVEKQMRETIVKTPTDSVCIKCHVTQAHEHHPAYYGQPQQFAHRGLGKSGAPAWHYSGYSVKTCGSCHYDRYKHWTSERHSELSGRLPAKYRTDQGCAACHPKTNAGAISPRASADPHDQRIGAACESCHGPGLEHVQFTMRFISSPALSPSQEQAARQAMRKERPKTSCIQCHVGQSHKKHPEYEKNG